MNTSTSFTLDILQRTWVLDIQVITILLDGLPRILILDKLNRTFTLT